MNWNLLAEGAFFSVGLLVIDNIDGNCKDSRFLIGVEHMNNIEYISVYDTVYLSGNSYKYRTLSIPQRTTVRIGLDKAVGFLKKDEREYLLKKFSTAFAKCLKFCERSMWSSLLIVMPPAAAVPTHIHVAPPESLTTAQLTFTYISSSGHSPISSALVVGGTKIPFPTTGDSYFFFDSAIPHSVVRGENDTNTYLFYIFDGITLKEDRPQIESLVMYSVTQLEQSNPD